MTEDKLKKAFRSGKELTDEEVQKLRDLAKAYAKKGGKYLEGGTWEL